jgi:hypothetical protein
MPGTLARPSIAAAILALLMSGGVFASDLPVDLDEWHSMMQLSDDGEAEGVFALGLYPGIAGVLGAPNLVSYQPTVYLSLGDGRSFSLFFGYGEERGSPADAEVFTVGWGGVRRLASAAPQRGFYGKFLRCRRWDHRHHGIHHGLSVGSETGIGYLSFAWELGLARSDRNHWMVTAQVSLKVALPVFIPLG